MFGLAKDDESTSTTMAEASQPQGLIFAKCEGDGLFKTSAYAYISQFCQTKRVNNQMIQIIQEMSHQGLTLFANVLNAVL